MSHLCHVVRRVAVPVALVAGLVAMSQVIASPVNHTQVGARHTAVIVVMAAQVTAADSNWT